MIHFERDFIDAKAKEIVVDAYNKVKGLKKRTKEMICIGMTVMMLGSFVTYDVCAGVAYASGAGEGVPHAIMAGDREIAVVQSKSDAEMVIEKIKAEYGKNDNNTAIITPTVTIVEKEIAPAEAVDVKTTQEATTSILEMNKGDNPAFKMVVTQPGIAVQTIEPETKIVETNEYKKGEEVVKNEGKAGKKVILAEQKMVNGKLEASTVYSEEVTVQPEAKVIYKGTKEEVRVVRNNRNNSSSSSSYSGPVRSYNPSTSYGVLGYAQGLHGVPYVYGGTSTAGFDCSGFTQYVYSAFGVSLPRSSGGQAGVGSYVPASEARAGDLVIMPGHVGIYAGNGMITHAPRPGKSVCTVPIWRSCTFRRVV